jgi:hypothetical protein
MQLPGSIELHVICNQDEGLEDLIVGMEVAAGRKNPFRLFFPKTDSFGKAQLAAEDFRGQFMDHFETGLMDYDGSIESAREEVGLQLFNPEMMRASMDIVRAWPLLKYERTKWKSRQQVIDYFLSSRNNLFRADQQYALITESPLVLRVEWKAA